MLAYLALAIRLLGVYFLGKSFIWLTKLAEILYWQHDAQAHAARMLAEGQNGWPTTFSEQKLNLMVAAAGLPNADGLDWLSTAHFAFWLLLGSFFWSRGADLARLIMKGVPQQ